MVGAANSDSARISFFGSTKGELAQKLDGGQDAIGPPAADSSAPRTARNGRLLHGSLTLPGVGARCVRVMEGVFNSHFQVLHYALKLSRDISVAWESKVHTVVRQPRWVRWLPPEPGSFVLNTDGSVKELGSAHY
ncbi:RING/U-box superfamily protein [Striga asiatica]|uniref:RING/U-box superfamily protein n=1 Tax=Striga asiatica TaxID=4170 RepID=A0A5A7QMA8_STRAF|nr:RING/U-box superfamily protein [Striga asiatica]